MLTDTQEHYCILGALMGYMTDGDAARALSALRERGIATDDRSGFTPRVRQLLDEIEAAASPDDGGETAEA